jgi:signal transduction histidine kinase
MVLFSSSVLLLFIFIYWETVGYMAMQTDATIEAEIQGLEEQYQRLGLNGLVMVIAERIARNPREAGIYLLTAPNYIRIAGNLSNWPLVPQTPDGWLNFELEDSSTSNHQRYQARARPFMLPGRRHLLVGRNVRELKATEALIIHALGWGLAMTVGLALFGGLMMSGSTLRRLETINQTCRDIMKGDLSRRIPTKGTSDDFDQLADNLNTMLDKIEILMAGVRQVADNIAHDLRTPLTRLRNRLELLRRQPPAKESYEELIDQNISEADQLLATFNALLRIAQIESGSRLSHHLQVNLTTLVQDAAELYEALAYDKQQLLTLKLANDVSIYGDRDLLFQALANLLDNAVKYTPVGGQISVTLISQIEFAEIRIIDTGPGIPTEARDKVFERFFRSETSRNTPGNGLGLSLVAAVAKLHHSQLELADHTPGLSVIWRLPKINQLPQA